MSADEDSDLQMPGAYRDPPVQESSSYLARIFPRLSTFMSLNLLAITVDSSRTDDNHFEGSVNGYIRNVENGQDAIAYSSQRTTVQDDTPRSALEIIPDSKADYDIYYDQLLLRKRGCPLYLPGPLQTLPVKYRRTGTQIGDIGIIYRTGFFDYLFNILYPADHPINRGRVPEGFEHFDFAPAVTRRHVAAGQAFDPGSYLASACMRKRSNSDGGAADSDFIFETTENEGAVLVLPSGSKFQDLLSKGCLIDYIAENADQWYSFIRGTCGRVGVCNGDVRLVVGFDKAYSWGIATFACSQQPGRLEFKRHTPSGSFAYTWLCREGIGNGKSGPLDDEMQDLRRTTNEPPLQNQTIFIRTMNFTLRGEIPDDPDSIALQVRPSNSRMEGLNNSDLFQGDSSRTPSGNQTQTLTTSAARHPQVGKQRGVNFFPSHFELPVIHPSAYLNQALLDRFPNAKIAITDDLDWISAIREDDLAFPSSKDLCQRLLQSCQVSEENGIVTVSTSAASIRDNSSTQPAVDDPREPILRHEGVRSPFSYTSEQLKTRLETPPASPACGDDASYPVNRPPINLTATLVRSIRATVVLLFLLYSIHDVIALWHHLCSCSPIKLSLPCPQDWPQCGRRWFITGQGYSTSPWQNISEVEDAVFERLMKEASSGYALSSFIQDAQTGISNLAIGIQSSDFSDISQKDSVAKMIAKLSADAKKTEKGLRNFSKKVDAAFDKVFTNNGRALRTIEQAHAQRYYEYFRPWGHTTQDVVAKTFEDTIDILEGSMGDLVLEAERNYVDLQGVFHSIGEILREDNQDRYAAGFDYWPFLQFDTSFRTPIARGTMWHKSESSVLRHLGKWSEERSERIHSSLLILRELGEEVEVLREKVTEGKLLRSLPVREHIRSIAEGLEKLKERRNSADKMQQEPTPTTPSTTKPSTSP